MGTLSDGKLMVVWEANSLVPVIFTDPEEAHAYRTRRIKQGRIKHQVYVQPATLDEFASKKKV